MPIATEQPKKPAGGAYGIFMAEKRPEFQKACAGKPVTEVSKMGSEAWKKLTDAQKAPYQKKYEEAKAQFDKNMAAFLAGGGEKTKGAAALRSEKRKARELKRKDPNAPKKPSGGGYGVYLAENRAKIVKSLPAGSNQTTDVAKAAGAQWKALSDAEKKPFNDKFLKRQEEYQAAFAEYKKNLPEGAEEDEEEEDNDEEEEEEEKEVAPPSKKARKGNA